MGSWEKAMDDLLAGNERFVSGESKARESFEARRRELLEDGQRPMAVILSTADSYMPPEIVFDADLGDLYVLRMPFLAVDRDVIDAVEFAARELGVALCLILDHAPRAGDPEAEEDEGFFQFFRREEAEPEHVRIKTCVQKLRDASGLEELINRGEFFVAGASYDLATGIVTVFDFLSD